MERKYMKGGFGGHAKNELLDLIIEKFSKEEIYFELMSEPEKIEQN